MLTLPEIRDRLNNVAFKDGTRQVSLGEMTDLFDGENDATAIARLERELANHDLELVQRNGELIVVQRLRHQPQDYSWISRGFEWASRILAIAAEMVLPGLAGMWLDDRWGTGFLALVGIGLGVMLGIWHLTWLAKAGNAEP